MIRTPLRPLAVCFVPVNAAKIRTISNRKTCACADKSCAIPAVCVPNCGCWCWP